MKFALLLIACLTSASVLAQTIGLQMYSLRHQFEKNGFEQTLSTIHLWGIEALEQGNMGTHGHSIDAYKTLLDEYNLKLVSASATYEELKKSPQMVLKRAMELNTSYVVCFWIPHSDTTFTITETKEAVEVFNAAGKILKDRGITLVYHPHGYEFRPYQQGMLMDYMMENAQFFDFEMDVYWFAHAGEDPVQWLRKYPRKFKLLHLKDCAMGTEGNQNGTSDVETNVTLGTGTIDIKAVVEEAKLLGIKYMFIEDESSNVVEQVPASLAYLRDL